ncbi:MAG TPA: TVP38/TMEM64 family protein [Longimicrobium sp.]
MSTSVMGGVAGGPRPRRRRVNWKKVALATVIFGSLVAFFALGGQRWASFEALKEHREALLAFTRRNYAAMLVGAALVYTAATALSFPVGLAMSLAVGFLFGRWVGTALVVVSASVGSTLAFLSARYLFAESMRKKMGPRLQRLARGFHEDGFNYVLFTRLVPVFPFWLMNLVPAFTPVSTRTFFAATAIGILPGSFVFCWVGESLGRIESTRELVSADVLLSLTLLGLLSLVPILWKKLRTRRRRGAR